MITRAIVIVSAAMASEDVLRPIAGVPALLRLLLSVQRAGVGEIFLLGATSRTAALRKILQDRRLLARVLCLDDQPRSALIRVAPELEKTWWEDDLWVLPAGAVVDVVLLREVAQQAVNQPVAVLSPWPIPAPQAWPACLRVDGPWLRRLLETSGEVPLAQVLTSLPRSDEAVRLPHASRVCAPWVTRETQAAVERGLLAGLHSTSDGWVDRHFNRRLSSWFSRWFLRTPLTPNHVTLMALALGLLAAVGFAQEAWLGHVIGALLLQWSAVIDCCDGEVARLKFLESPSGFYLDIVGDNVVHVAVFVAIAWSSYTSLGRAYPLWLGGIAAFGTVMALVVILTTRHGRARHVSATLDRLVDALTNRDFSVLLIVFALAGKLHWFLWALAIGVNLFWPIALGLGWKASRMTHE
jgi:phosphatidylglycerophosphate synthase